VAFELSPLPYAEDALEPAYSARTISFHYGKHHRTYVDTLNKLTAGTELEGSHWKRSSAPSPVTPPRCRCSTTPPRCGTTPSSGTA